MLVAGIDVGARNISVVILKDSALLSSRTFGLGGEGAAAAQQAMAEACGSCGMTPGDFERVVATGCGRGNVPFAQRESTEVVCQAKGAIRLFPEARTVVNLGAESSRVMRVGEGGRVEAFAKNDKCAAGSGLFLETMAVVLETPLEQLGELSLRAEDGEEVSSICAVFAESEVISHIHRGVSRERILAGVHRAMVDRVMQMVGRVGIRGEVVVTGGVARNRAIISELERRLDVKVVVPPEPQVVGALGAAVLASEMVVRRA